MVGNGIISYLSRGLGRPHGTIPVRVYHPTTASSSPPGTLIYPQGGVWTVCTLDQFEGAMRIFALESGVQVYAVEYQLAPEYQYPVALEEAENARITPIACCVAG